MQSWRPGKLSLVTQGTSDSHGELRAGIARFIGEAAAQTSDGHC